MIIDPYVWHKTPILKLDHVSDDTIAITVAKPDDYTFLPGQYSLIRVETELGMKQIRQYSFSSSPTSTTLEFLIRRAPLGKVSSWLFGRAQLGDLIEITKPYGHFIRSSRGSKHILIAGGVGIAPFLSMIREDVSDTELVYSERSRSLVISEEELSTLLGEHCYTHLSGSAGRLNTDSLKPFVQSDSNYYLCGSKQFVDSIEAVLIGKLNVAPTHIHREAFTLQ